MNGMTFLIAFSIYFVVAAFLQYFEFKDYVNGKQYIPDRYIVSRNLECWLWPLYLLLGIVFALAYGGLMLFCWVAGKTWWKVENKNV